MSSSSLKALMEVEKFFAMDRKFPSTRSPSMSDQSLFVGPQVDERLLMLLSSFGDIRFSTDYKQLTPVICSGGKLLYQQKEQEGHPVVLDCSTFAKLVISAWNEITPPPTNAQFPPINRYDLGVVADPRLLYMTFASQDEVNKRGLSSTGQWLVRVSYTRVVGLFAQGWKQLTIEDAADQHLDDLKAELKQNKDVEAPQDTDPFYLSIYFPDNLKNPCFRNRMPLERNFFFWHN